MKYYLWILNSWLIILFFLATGVSTLLKQTPPVVPIRPIIEEPTLKKPVFTVNLEKIYQNDLFDTLIIKEAEPSQKSLVTPIPELKPAQFTPPPPVQKPQFIPPLNVILKGIILSSEEQNSVAMIADEVGKENMYHLGEKVKDGQIIKIARNRVILLRSNGQQETLFLRKEDNKLSKSSIDRWKIIVNKISDTAFEINPDEFAKEASSLGEFVESLKLTTAYKTAKAVGIKIGSSEQNQLVSMIGLQKNDIITSINNIETADIRNRLNIYDQLVALPLGSTVKLDVLRNNNPINISYVLKKIELPVKKTFDGVSEIFSAPTSATPSGEELFRLSPLQEREQAIRDFESMHPSAHDQTVIDLRKRLFENMKIRSQDMRVR